MRKEEEIVFKVYGINNTNMSLVEMLFLLFVRGSHYASPVYLYISCCYYFAFKIVVRKRIKIFTVTSD